MNRIRVALVGATSHIAKGLIACWLTREDRELLLYARAPERVREFLAGFGRTAAQVHPVEGFGQEPYDVVVNCVGVGSPTQLELNPADVFAVTARFDDLILAYLARRPETLYVNLSSGAAYGVDFSQPVHDGTHARFELNDLKGQQFYGIAKLHSEAKHRALAQLNIVDIRIFGYFSRYIDLEEKFLLSEMVSCVKSGATFVTSAAEIWRDVLHPLDMTALVDACIGERRLNCALDAYSRKEASKSEFLEFFAGSYGLKYRIEPDAPGVAVGGQKSRYYPVGRKAASIGYQPRFSSMEGVEAETAALLTGWRGAGPATGKRVV
jgi:nucleoside-diphosphate-sugar epimerase